MGWQGGLSLEFPLCEDTRGETDAEQVTWRTTKECWTDHQHPSVFLDLGQKRITHDKAG